MPVYQYRARDENGSIAEGTIETASEENAAALLSRRNPFVISLVLKSGQEAVQRSSFTFLNKVGMKDLVIFSRQLATMIDASVPIVRALRTLSAQVTKPAFQEVITDLANKVESGTKFSEALVEHRNVFNNFFINIIRAGETAGEMDKSLRYLADSIEKEYDLRQKIIGALYYPVFIIIGVVVVGVVMMALVVPQLSAIFAEFEAELPLPTRMLMATSHFLSQYWWLVIIALVGLGFLLRYWVREKDGRKILDQLILKVPLLGSLLRKIYVARFTMNLSTLVQGGLPIVRSLHLVGDVIGSAVFKEVVDEAARRVENGEPIANAILESEEFPLMVGQMISIGEETGKLDEILIKVSSYFTKEVDTTVKALTSLLEPILMIIIGAAAGIIVASIILPIYSLVDVIG